MKYYSRSTGGFYSKEIHIDAIPIDAVEISEADYQTLLDEQSAGKVIVADNQGHPVLVEPPPISLEQIKVSALTRIDAEAEAERGKYITPGSGQAMVYQAKQDEAVALLALERGVTFVPEEYPHLRAEVGLTGDDIYAVAHAIMAMKAGWTRVSATIEAARLSAKAAIRACTTVEAVDQVLDSLRWS